MRAEHKGRIPSLDLLATLLWMQPGILLSFWVVNILCQLRSSFTSTSIPKSFSVGLLSIHSSPSLYWYWGLPQPRCRTLHLDLNSIAHLISKAEKTPIFHHPSKINVQVAFVSIKSIYMTVNEYLFASSLAFLYFCIYLMVFYTDFSL